MPKSIREIKDFNLGTVLNVSEKDIPDNAAAFSLNINPMAEGGILDSIYNNRLIASVNNEAEFNFLNPVNWNYKGDNTATGLNGYSYNSSDIVIDNLAAFNNQSYCKIKAMGIKGYEESLIASSIEPWWEVTKVKSAAYTTDSHYLRFNPTSAIEIDSSILSYADIGKAYTTVTATDGDAADGTTNGQYITLIDSLETEKHYVISDTNAGGASTGTVLDTTTDIGSDTLSALTTLTEGVAIGLNLSSATQNDVLTQLKAAIEHANGHNGTIEVSSIPTSADGRQNITLTQGTAGSAGNTVVTYNIATITVANYADSVGNFAGGLNFEEEFNVGDYLSIVDTEIAGTTATPMTVNLAAGYAATTSSQAIVVADANAVEATHKDRIFVKSDGSLIGICTAVGSTTGITFGGGLITPLSNDDILYMVKSFDGNISHETLQITDIDNISKECIVNRRCFGTIGTTFSDTITITNILTDGSAATATCSADHNLTTGDRVTISGTRNYNGTVSITRTSATAFTFTTAIGATVDTVNDLDVASGIASVTTAASHGLAVGDVVYIDASNNTYDAEVTVASTDGSTGFTYETTLADVTNLTGTVGQTGTCIPVKHQIIYSQRETINNSQLKVTKGTCYLSDWSNYSGNHIGSNASSIIQGKNTANQELAGKFTLGSGDSVTYSTDKTITLTGMANAPYFVEGDTITLYHSTASTSNSGSSFKILKIVDSGSDIILTVDTTPTVSSGTSETISSGTLYFESNLIKNGSFFHRIDTASEDGGADKTWKANDWAHKGYVAVDSTQDTYNNDYEYKNETGVASISQLVDREATGGWLEDTLAGHPDVAGNYYPFSADDTYMYLESEYWGTGDVQLATGIGTEEEVLNVKLATYTTANSGEELTKRLSAGDIILIGSEYMEIAKNGVDGSKINVIRGIYNSTIASHLASADIKKNLNTLITQDISKDRIKKNQTYELTFKAKGSAITARGFIALTLNGGRFNIDGTWKKRPSKKFNRGINSSFYPQSENRWISVGGLNEDLETYWQEYTYRFEIPEDLELNTDLTLELSSRGPDGTKVGFDNVNIIEYNHNVAVNEMSSKISTSSFIENRDRKDLVVYDSKNDILRVIQDFRITKLLLAPIDDLSIEKSPYLGAESKSESGNISMIPNNREMHIGFDSNPSSSNPQWLGYINNAVFGNDVSEDLYLDEDTVHSYDGGAAGSASGSFSKLCLAGEHEYLEATWTNGTTLLTISHTAHSCTIGDNIVVREWGDTNNEWRGSGVWIVTSVSTDEFVCKRYTTLDENPPNNGFLDTADVDAARDTNDGRVCYRPYYYYGIRDNGYQIYRIFPDARIRGSRGGAGSAATDPDASPDTGDGTIEPSVDYLKGYIQSSQPLNFKTASIATCYNKESDGTGGGRIYVLKKNSDEVAVINVERSYEEWDDSELTLSGNLSMNYRSFKWSNDIITSGDTPTGNIRGGNAVYDSSADISTPKIDTAGFPSDIIETKGTEPTYDIDATTNTSNQPNDFGTRLWVQMYHGAGNDFTEGSRFLFCGLTNSTNTNASGTINMGDRTPSTTLALPQRPRYRSDSPYDDNLKFYGGPGPCAKHGDRFDINTDRMSNDIQKRYAYFRMNLEGSEEAGRVEGLHPVYNNKGDYESSGDDFSNNQNPYKVYNHGGKKIPYFHFGHNVGWDAKGGRKPKIQVAKYGLVAMGDNDCDGVIDGTGLVTANNKSLTRTGRDGIKTGPYGHYHQRVCSHAVGLIGGCDRPWVRNWGRLQRYTKSMYEAGRSRSSKFTYHKDAPEHMNADKVLWICSDIHFGDYTMGADYSVTSISEVEDHGGISSNDIIKMKLSGSGTKNLQAGDTFWMTSTGSSDIDEVSGYIVEQTSAKNFNINLQWPSDTSIGTTTIYPFEAGGNVGSEWGSQKLDRKTMAVGYGSKQRLFHYAFNPDSKGSGNVFTKKDHAPGHYAKKWWTPPACFGHSGSSPTAWGNCSPGILHNIERLNYRAGYMMRPFSMANDTFENLIIGAGTCIDMPTFPNPIYHARQGSYVAYGTGSSSHKNEYASKLFITSPDGSGNSRMYACNLNSMYPDKTTQIQVDAKDAKSEIDKTNEYNKVDTWDIVFGGKITSYASTAIDSAVHSDATLHPVVKVNFKSSSELTAVAGGFSRSILDKKYYKKTNHWAGYCISYRDAGSSLTGAIETRYIIGSQISGDYLYLKLHYPFKTPPANDDIYWVWNHHHVCTSSVRLWKQYKLGHGLGFANNQDPWNEQELWRNETDIKSTSGAGGATTVLIETKHAHYLAPNDKVKITGTADYNGTHSVTSVEHPRFFNITKTNSGTSNTSGSITVSGTAQTESNMNSNPIYLSGISHPTFVSTFGGLDMRKTRTINVATIDGDSGDIDGIEVAELTTDAVSPIRSTSNHLLFAGDMIHHKGSGSDTDFNGTYIIKNIPSATKIDVYDTDNSDVTGGTGDDYLIRTWMWENLLVSTSGIFRMGEIRAGINSWDKGNSDYNLIRYDKSSVKDNLIYMVPDSGTQPGVEVIEGSIEDSSGYFQAGINYEYKLSFIYDGYQEGLLTDTIYNFSDTADRNAINIVLRIASFSKRLTHICVYRRDDTNDLFKLVEEIKTDETWALENDLYRKLIVDKGPLGATYESRSGLNEVLDDIKVKYEIATEIDGYLFVGRCSHDKIKNASNLVFRSKPGKFSIFDYVNDTIQLKSAPTAMANFMGRLYLFDKENTYRVNQESLVIEDIYEGIGCSSQASVVVTEYGMFYCDDSGAYMHNGTTPNKISNTIFRGGNISGTSSFSGTDNINDVSWDAITIADKKAVPLVVFDSGMQSVLFLVRYYNSNTDKEGLKTYYLWSYNIPKQRWDLWELAQDVDVGNPFVGDKGRVCIPMDSGIYEIRGGSTKKDWTWISKKVNADVDSVLKVFNKVKVNGNSDNLTLGGNYLESSDRLLINTNLGSVSSSDVTYKEDSTNNASYKLKGSNRKGRWMQLKLENMNNPIDSIGIIFRLRAVK